MKGLIAAIALAFMAATIAPAIAEVAGGTIQVAEGKKGAKKMKAHKPAKKHLVKAHKAPKKGKKGKKA
jgi:hypothetical protein